VIHLLGEGRYGPQSTRRVASGCVITRCNRMTIAPRYALPYTPRHALWGPSN